MDDRNTFWRQAAFPVMAALFCGAVLLLVAIDPYSQLGACFQICYMANQSVSHKGGLSDLTVVQSDIEPTHDGAVYENGEIAYPEYGAQYALLTAEKGDLYVPVYWGTGNELLKKGACQMPSSAFIGCNGNTVISAHVNTYYRELDQLKAGDTVMLYTDYGQFTYTVTKRIAFSADDLQYLQKTEDSCLTLYTCEKNALAESAKRVGVVCRLDQRAYYTEKAEETE